MYRTILIVLVLFLYCTPSFASSETVSYRCSDGEQSEFQIDQRASKVAIKNFGIFRGLEIAPPVSSTSSSAQWLMKDTLFPACTYTANVKFYTATGFSCPSGKGAEITIHTVCPDGKGRSTNWCCGQ